MGKNISVIGIGYIGSVIIPCLGKLGHKVIGVDTDSRKVNCINRGKSPIEEEGLDELTFKQRQKGNIKATISLKKAINQTEICFICVGTPGKKDGSVELKYLTKVCKDLGKILKTCKDKKYLVIRSTIFPGTLEKMRKIVEEYSGKIEGEDFFMLHQPEFMREGSSVKDFFNPSLLVVGSESLYHGENAWHANKIVFCNEISAICKKMDISAINLMNLFVQDEQLNISPYYLKPGFAYGGSCLIPGSLIHLKNGMKPIEKVDVGDEVLTHDKKFHKVTQKFVRKTTQGTIQVNPKSLPSFELTGEHPVFAVQSFRKSQKGGKLRNNKIVDWTPSWVLAEELKRGDYLVFAIPNEVKKISYLTVPDNLLRSNSVKVLIPNKIKITKDLMRLFGYYISEGSKENQRIALSFNSNSLNEINDVKNIINKHFKLNINISKINKNKTCTCVRIYSKQLSGFVEKYCSKLAWNKKLHEDVMYLSLDLQKEFIKAAWITDGSLDKLRGCWTWATVSRQLFNQMKILLLRQGITFSTSISKAHKGKDGVNHREAYYIMIGNRTSINIFNKIMNISFEFPKMKEKEHKTSWIDKGYLYYPISSVNKTDYKGLVYNLEVDGSHSYSCEGATLHNCLGKETNALINIAKNLKVDTPLLNNIPISNDAHIVRAIELIKSKNKKKLGFFGLSFKQGTNDQRSNPILKVIEHFKGLKSYDVKTWDYYEDYIKEHDGLKMDECLNQDIIIISARDKELLNIACDVSYNKIIIDLQE